MTSYSLTISIPTWNRLPYLQENVDQLLQEIAKLPQAHIEILVSDNASTDGTQAYCESLAKTYSFFSYIRNATNLGANKNFQQAVQEAKGDYVWLLGDDDLIVENCLGGILNDIETYHHPEIVIGGSVNDQTKLRLYPPFVDQPLLTDKHILAQYDAIKIAGKISVLIFKKSTLFPVSVLCEPIIQTLKTPWPHLTWLCVLLNQNANILFLPYGTNYFLEKNRCNMLQDGISRINVMVREYATLIYCLNDEGLLSPDFYQILVHSITHRRQEELFKVVGYVTYFNGYLASIKAAFKDLVYLRDFYNRANFFTFYTLPILLPIPVRKTFFSAIAKLFPKWSEYQRYIQYLRKTKALFNDKNKRNIFNKGGL